MSVSNPCDFRRGFYNLLALKREKLGKQMAKTGFGTNVGKCNTRAPLMELK